MRYCSAYTPSTEELHASAIKGKLINNKYCPIQKTRPSLVNAVTLLRASYSAERLALHLPHLINLTATCDYPVDPRPLMTKQGEERREAKSQAGLRVNQMVFQIRK